MVDGLAGHLDAQAEEELRGSTALREHVAAVLAASRPRSNACIWPCATWIPPAVVEGAG